MSSVIDGTSSSSASLQSALKTKIQLNGNTGSFLTDQQVSPVQRMIAAQKKQAEKATSFTESETYLRMKATQLSALIRTYKNLGLSAEYESAQAEAYEVIKKYQAMLKKASTGTDSKTATTSTTA